MFRRQHNTDFADAGTTRTPNRPRFDRAKRRDRELEAERISELRWQWRCACSGTPLGQMIYTPSGATRAVPVIGQIELGPPVSLMVRVRTGQSPADFVAAAPALATAMNVAAVEVHSLAPQWVRIVLVTAPRVAMPGSNVA